MEFQFPAIPLLIIFFSFMVVIKARENFKSKSTAPNIPPGPWKLPVIGNMHQLVVSPLVHHTLRDLAKKYGPLMRLKLGEVSTVIVSSPEMAAEVMKTHDTTFASRPILLASEILFYNSSDIAFSPYGLYWKQLRKICIMELLSLKRVQTFQRIREEEVSNLIKSVSSEAGVPTNLSKKIFSMTYAITARTAFGEKSKYQDAFISIVEESQALIAGFNVADMFPSVKCLQEFTGMRKRLEKMHKRIDEILQAILDEHKDREGKREIREKKVEDLVDVLLRIQKNGGLQFLLTNENIKAVIYDIFSAGSETSSATVEWAISEMLKNPKVMEKAQTEVREVFQRRGDVDETGVHELKYLKLVIKETLRLHPSAPLLLPRVCSEDCEINGYIIPENTRVIVNAWAIGRDPKYWSQPENFIPERFVKSRIDFKGSSFEFIPFGAGRRICPGISFAVANIELPLAKLIYHFDWKLAGGSRNEELDMAETFGLTVRRKNDLYLVPIPH